MMSEKSIFREKSLDQLSQPDQLTEYIHVTGPGVWVALAGLLIVIAGVLIWSVFGTLISSVKVPARVSDGKINCYILRDDLSKEEQSVEITVGDVKIEADTQGASTLTMTASDEPQLYSSGYLSPGKKVVILSAATELTDGFYDADVIVNEIKPISLFFAKN